MMKGIIITILLVLCLPFLSYADDMVKKRGQYCREMTEAVGLIADSIGIIATKEIPKDFIIIKCLGERNEVFLFKMETMTEKKVYSMVFDGGMADDLKKEGFEMIYLQDNKNNRWSVDLKTEFTKIKHSVIM